MNVSYRIPAALAAILLSVTVAATPSVSATHWESIESLPGHPGVTVLVNENPRIYFRVTPETPLTIAVDGPAVLRVVSRAELPTGSAQIASYHLRATENGYVPVILFAQEKKKRRKKQSGPGMGMAQQFAERLIDAQKAFADNLADSTDSSQRKKSDGGLMDLPTNLIKAAGAAGKKLRFHRIPV